MTLSQRLAALRREMGLSQVAIGAQGFVSTPGWIKLENGQRAPSDALIRGFVNFLVRDKHLAKKNAQPLVEELLTLKYLAGPSEFVRRAVRQYASGDEAGANVAGRQLLAAFDAASKAPRSKAKNGRPAKAGQGKGGAR